MLKKSITMIHDCFFLFNVRKYKVVYLTDKHVNESQPINQTTGTVRWELDEENEWSDLFLRYISRLFFNSKMIVTEQFWAYGFMSYIAETGGFVGLFLGCSLLQLELVILYFSKFFQAKQRDNINDENIDDVTVDQSKQDLFQKEAFDLVFNLQRFSNRIQTEKDESQANDSE